MKTFCRLCEVNCGLEATVDSDGRIATLAPDKAHPVTAGFACHKGLLARDVHHDPDRVNTPQRRTPRGFEEATWDDAIPSIASELSRIIGQHGPNAVATYLGNPFAFNATGSAAAGMFASVIGSERTFNSGTQDCSNKFALGEILYGSAQIHPMADLDHADYVLMIGTNPRVSKMSFLSTPDPVGTLRAARKRGAEIVFVNPLALTDLADVGPTLQIRPDTDVYLLAAMLCEIESSPGLGFDAAALAGVDGVDPLRSFVRRYPAERVAAIVGVPAEQIREIARAFATAERAAVHASTGINMGRQGFLAYYLVQMLSLVTGNMDRRGGNVLPARGVPARATPDEVMAPRTTRWGDYRPAIGTVPGALLADFLLSDEEPIRAMIVMAGNPVLSIGGGARLAEAFESLELLVTLDYYRNATGELADWVLPAADQFEREDLNYFVQGMQRRPYLQWTDAVVQPKGERRTDAWILSRLLQELGRPSLFDLPGDDWMSALWDDQLAGGGHSVAELRAAKGNTIVLPESDHGGFLERMAKEGRFDCCPPEVESTFARADALFEELLGEAGATLKLIMRRTHYMLNSALQNVKALREARGGRTNPLYMNPNDARDRGLTDGQWVIVRSDHGELRAELEIDADLGAGTVAMTHGFGNANASGMPVAQSMPGVNVNVLSPSGAGSFDPVGGMSQLTGIAVEVESA